MGGLKTCKINNLECSYDVCSTDFNMLRSDADKYLYLGKGYIESIEGKAYTYKKQKHFWVLKKVNNE